MGRPHPSLIPALRPPPSIGGDISPDFCHLAERRVQWVLVGAGNVDRANRASIIQKNTLVQ